MWSVCNTPFDRTGVVLEVFYLLTNLVVSCEKRILCILLEIKEYMGSVFLIIPGPLKSPGCFAEILLTNH